VATLDVLTIDEALDALKGLSEASAPRVQSRVTALSGRLDAACGPIVKRATTELFRNGTGGVGYHAAPGNRTPFNTTNELMLAGKPFAPSTAVVSEAYAGETPVVVTPATYVFEDDGVGGRLVRFAGWWAPRVTVTYDAGRFADTTTVSPLFKEAAAMYLQHLWRRSDGGGSETYGPPIGFTGTGLPSFGVPNVVKDLLYGELLPPAVG